MEDWCSIQANTPLYFPHRSNTPDITPAHLSSSSLMVIIKTFIAVKILITDDHDQNSLCLDCTWKGQSICLCSYCGSNQQKNGTSRSTELRSANVSGTQISIYRMKVKYQKWLYREMIKPFCEICIFCILSEL